jgi:hypothetical protein
MSAKTGSRKKSLPSLPSAPRTVLTGLDPVSLVRIFDEDVRFDDRSYQALYAEMREAFLERAGHTSVTIAKLLTEIDDCLAEDAFRQAGFVVGFEVCRRLLLGELDLAALKASGDEDEGGAR